MKNRSKSYYRHHRERVIARKWYIVHDIWKTEEYWIPRKGSLSKNKVHCSCTMCKYEKHYRIPKHTHASKWKQMKQEMKDYLNGD